MLGHSLIRKYNSVISGNMNPNPMTSEQFESVKSEINRIYLFLLGHSNFELQVVEVMKLAALSEVQKRFEAGEKW